MAKDERIKEYTLADGSSAYMFRCYVGVNPINGKRRQTTRRGFTSYKAAKLALTRLELEIEETGLQPKARDSYQSLYDLWITEYEKTVKSSTLGKTKRLFKNHILPAFGECRIEKVDVLFCQSVMNDWSQKLVRAPMVMNYAGMVFDYAIRLGWLTSNPTKNVIKPRQEAKKNTDFNFYDKETLKLFLDICKIQYAESNFKVYTLFHLLAFSGMRKGEALALTWKDINFMKGTVTIDKTLSLDVNNKLVIQTPKTSNSYRDISLDADTISILREWRSRQKENYLLLGFNTSDDSQLIFSNTKNEFLTLSKPRKWLMVVQEKMDLAYPDKSFNKITTHGFRHTHCSLLFEAGATIPEVQDRLGHSDVQTTMNIYAHVTEKSKDKVADKFLSYYLEK